jgi:osmoprotectant transport system permease protein
MALIRFWLSHRAELASLVAQHVLIVAISTSVAVAIAVPLGVFAFRRPRLGAPLVSVANIVQTIPSLAMFGFLLPVPLLGGVGTRAAIVVLILYALLPIVRTTIAGLQGIDASVREAGVAMGMSPRELLRHVELPLALPSIVAGIRVAAVVGVGSATIAAAIGAGGLGEYIFRGLSMVDTTTILAGAGDIQIHLRARGSLWIVDLRQRHHRPLRCSSVEEGMMARDGMGRRPPGADFPLCPSSAGGLANGVVFRSTAAPYYVVWNQGAK